MVIHAGVPAAFIGASRNRLAVYGSNAATGLNIPCGHNHQAYKQRSGGGSEVIGKQSVLIHTKCVIFCFLSVKDFKASKYCINYGLGIILKA
jgi:hypothetical protein